MRPERHEKAFLTTLQTAQQCEMRK